MKNINNAPILVKSALWGVNSRSVAIVYLVLCVVLAVATAIFFGYFLATFFSIAALWYAVGIRWVDKNATWNQSGE
jgi:hypothetical protein